jgi:hypothetical protein
MATLEERLARVRGHIHAALLESGNSFRQYAALLGLESPNVLSDYLQGREEMPLWLFLKLAELTGKPVWWFFDEPPKGISLEAADVALQNVSRIRLYLEALESEFTQVRGAHAVTLQAVPEPGKRPEGSPRVVDFAPYLDRARAILEREVETEDIAEVSDESIEMVAQGLFNAATGRRSMEMSLEDEPPVRKLSLAPEPPAPPPKSTRNKVRHLPSVE